VDDHDLAVDDGFTWYGKRAGNLGNPPRKIPASFSASMATSTLSVRWRLPSACAMREHKHILTFPGRKNFIVLDLADEAEALKVARMLAEDTGQSVTVRDKELLEIETIHAPVRN
jgi:hypothetical protein